MRHFQEDGMSEYIVRNGSEIIGVNVSNRMRVPLEQLVTGVEIDDELYMRHLLGGGLVADSSYVPDTVSVPYDIIVGKDTHVVSDVGMIGQSFIWGNLHNPNQVSRVIEEEGRKLRVQQKLLGITARLLDIEQQKFGS